MTAPTAPATRRRPRFTRPSSKVLIYVLIAAICLITIFPIYWMFVSAIQPVGYSLHYPPPLFPKAVDWAPFAKLFETFPVASWLINSALLAMLTTLLVLALTVPGAYILSVLRWRGKGAFGLLLLLTQMLPEALIIVPIFAMYQRLGMRENIPAVALIDAAFVLPIGIWILKNMFDKIPLDIYDAALVDGCRPLGVLWRIMLPLSAPGLVAVGVVAFFHAWNEYLFASSLITQKEIWPASVGLSSLQSMIDTPIDRVLAAGLVFSIFPVLFYLAVQRYVVAGLTAGAVKG